MPIYEYECQACGHRLEVTQRISEPRLRDCPACSKPALERLISATSFTLKGGGWYKDGYGNTKQRTENQVTDRLQKAINDDKKKTELWQQLVSKHTAAASHHIAVTANQPRIEKGKCTARSKPHRKASER